MFPEAGRTLNLVSSSTRSLDIQMFLGHTSLQLVCVQTVGSWTTVRLDQSRVFVWGGRVQGHDSAAPSKQLRPQQRWDIAAAADERRFESSLTSIGNKSKTNKASFPFHRPSIKLWHCLVPLMSHSLCPIARFQNLHVVLWFSRLVYLCFVDLETCPVGALWTLECRCYKLHSGLSVLVNK